MTRLVIVDYGSGNLHSAAKAFERAARDVAAPVTVTVSSDPETVAAADRLVLPGVGAFGDCRRGLMAIDGLAEALEEAVEKNARPFFGICVGMQLMAQAGHEKGDHAGLGWLAGEIDPLEPADPALKIPHMGWNELAPTAAGRTHPVQAGIGGGDHVYFVHSYHWTGGDRDQILATTDYGGPVVAMVGRGTMIGTQFHPEKSQRVGLRLIANFLNWTP